MPLVEDRVREIIIDQLGLEASEVKLNTSFGDDLGAGFPWTSVEGAMGLEQTFALEITDGDAVVTFRGMQSRFSSDSGLG